MAKIPKISRTYRLNSKTISMIKDLAFIFEMSDADVINYCVTLVHEDVFSYNSSDEGCIQLTSEELSRAYEIFLPFD